MTQDEFIKKFVSVYPRLYVRLISYNFALSEPNLVDYGFLLSWDKYGVLGNSNIDWTKNLKIRYANRLGSEFIKPDGQHYLYFDKDRIKDDISDIAINPTARKYGLSLYSLKVSELTLDISLQVGVLTDLTISQSFRFVGTQTDREFSRPCWCSSPT